MKKKSWIIISCIVMLVVLVAIPFIINELYKIDSGYITMWGASDTLAFYGAFVGALGTIALGALALWQNHVFEVENDKAQKTLQDIIKRTNEISIINKIHWCIARINSQTTVIGVSKRIMLMNLKDVPVFFLNKDWQKKKSQPS